MEKIVTEYLRLLCEMCGARSTHLRVRFDDSHRPVLVIDQHRGADHSLPECVHAANQQMPLLAPASITADVHGVSGTWGAFDSVKALEHETSNPSAAFNPVKALEHDTSNPWAAFDPIKPPQHGTSTSEILGEPAGELEIAVGHGFSVSLGHPFAKQEACGTGWRFHVPRWGGEWRFEKVVTGFHAEVSLVFPDERIGFLNRRLWAVESMLTLLEALLEDYVFTGQTVGVDDESRQPLNPPLIGMSSAMVELRRKVRLVAACDIPVLVEGESGTGKEIIARNIHGLSTRRAKPLVIVNCLEMPSSLLQSELFGHLKGSFTGASRDRVGLIESAAGGTFFLDEIGEMPLSLQAVLLRVLQEKEVRRIGDSRRRTVDVRFIFATNRILRDLIEMGQFRRDLFYRIQGVCLDIPPLRYRKEDMLLLAQYFLELYARRLGIGTLGITATAARRLLSYSWPGNVRELKNEMERVATLHRGARKITPEQLSPHIREKIPRLMIEGTSAGTETLPERVQRLERRMIGDALKRFDGNRTRAANALGITRQGLLKKLKRLGIRGEIDENKQVGST